MIARLSLPIVAFVSIAASAHPVNLITNGSFESASVNPGGSFTTLSSGSTAITGWIVGGAGIDYIGGYWNAQHGSRSIDLSALSPGSISQTISTIVGQQYVLSFWLAANPDMPSTPSKKVAFVSAGNIVNQAFTSPLRSGGRPAINWGHYSVVFIALGSSTTITFASGENNAVGPALDNVSVEAVPEPATLALAGLGLAAAMRRRKRN